MPWLMIYIGLLFPILLLLVVLVMDRRRRHGRQEGPGLQNPGTVARDDARWNVRN